MREDRSSCGAPLRIVVVAPGSSIHAKRWAESLRERGHQVAWFAVTPEAPMSTLIQGRSTLPQWGSRSDGPLGKVISSWNLRRAVRAFRPQVTHLHYLNASLPIRLSAPGWPNLVVSTWGSDVMFAPREPERIAVAKRAILERASMITATSEYLRQVTLDVAESAVDVEVIPFGVDTKYFSPGSWPGEEEELIIGYAKRFAPTYGPDVLLGALPKVLERHPNVRLEMVGRGDREAYLRQAEELGIAHAVQIAPAVPHDRLVSTMRRFSIFCMPSRAESFGVSAVEAAACGLPIVASRVGGIPEIVEEGRSGLLVEPEDELGLAEALSSLLSNSTLRREMGEQGRRIAVEKFEWSGNVDQMESLYRRILKG